MRRTHIRLYDPRRGLYADESRTVKTKCKAKSYTPMKRNKEKNNRKSKLNITVREGTKQKLVALAELEKRSVSNLIEVMADERGKNWPSERA